MNTFGCQIAQVAVDTLTGLVTVERIVAVHDIGRVVNPMGARSQVMGGILQGVGFALSEERVVDPTTGTVVNAGLEDYKVPTIADLPEVVCEFVDTADPHLKLGIKGLGEPPMIPTGAAIGNAVAHALGTRLRRPLHAAAGAGGAGVKAFAYVRPARDRRRRGRPRPPRRARHGRRHRPAHPAGSRHPARRVGDRPARAGAERIDDSGDRLRIGATATLAELGPPPGRGRALHGAARGGAGGGVARSCARWAPSAATSASRCAAGTSATPT